MIKHPYLFTLVGVCTAVLAGCAAPPVANVPRPAAGPVPAPGFARHWTADLELSRENLESLHVHRDTVFAYSDRRTSYLLNREGGHLANIHSLPRALSLFPPLRLPGLIVYPTSSSLEVYDERGRHLRSTPLPQVARSGAAGSGRVVYIGLDYPVGGRIAAVDLERAYAVVLWEVMTFGGVSATPAMHQNVLYVGGEDGRVYAIRADGQPAWRLEEGSFFVTGGRILGDVRADEFGVYVASTDTRLYCLDPDSGRIRWQYFAGTSLTDGPVVTAGTVYQRVPGSGLAAIDKATGEFHRRPRWVAREAEQFLAEDERHTYVRLRDNRIAALDRQSGERRFTSERTDFTVFGVNTHDATIYAATRRGQVVAIRPVLRPGVVGEVVLNMEPLTIAAAN